MIIFTPNTVIKSTEVNFNFTEVQSQITDLQSVPRAYGYIGSNTAGGYKTLYLTTSGITFDGTNKLTVSVAGIYFIHAQQLISTTVNAVYWGIHKNGVFTRYGYMNGSVNTNDVIASDLLSLSVGDTIQIYQSTAISSAWQGEHSSFQMFCIKRT